MSAVLKTELSEDAFPAPLPEVAADLPLSGAIVQSADTNEIVFNLFDQRAEITALVVEEDGIPIGLINRNIFNGHIARPFHRELYNRKSCIAFMDKSPLQIDAATPIYEVAARAAEIGAKVVNDGFIVTRDGKALGIVNGVTLLRTMASLQEAQHKHLLSSIHYASTIQRALLSDSRRAIDSALGVHAGLVWEPRDVVGGDCFFARSVPRGTLVGLVDCTGHGVPGAMLSLLVSNSLERIYANDTSEDPATALISLDHYVRTGLNQDRPDSESDDGCDAAVLRIDREKKTIEFAGAKLSLFHVNAQSQFTRYQAARCSLGYQDYIDEKDKPVVQTIRYQSGDVFAIVTDGLTDQIGGNAAIKTSYGYKRIESILTANFAGNAQAIADAIQTDYAAWQGSSARRDDVTAVFFKL